MKKLLLLIACVFLVGCGGVGTPPPAAEYVAFPAPSSLPIPTATIQPTVTIGYQATANAAQATADGYSRLAIDATMASNNLTHEVDGWTVTVAAETATAIGTAVPITQTHTSNLLTANASELTASADQRLFVQAAWTATEHAPTQVVAQTRADVEAKYSDVNALVQIFALLMVALAMIAITVFAVAQNWKSPARPVPPISTYGVGESAEDYVPVALQTSTIEYPSVDYLLIPCSPVQLYELATGLLHEHKTLAIKHWEGAGTSLNRGVIYAVRQFLSANHMALSAGRGDMVLTGKGEEFFRAWLDVGAPPPPYEFDPEIGAKPEDVAHVQDFSRTRDGGGVAETTSPADLPLVD